MKTCIHNQEGRTCFLCKQEEFWVTPSNPREPLHPDVRTHYESIVQAYFGDLTKESNESLEQYADILSWDTALRAALERAERAEAKLLGQLPWNIHDQRQYEAVRAENERYKKALEFYAYTQNSSLIDRDFYNLAEDPEQCDRWLGGGTVAREALNPKGKPDAL